MASQVSKDGIIDIFKLVYGKANDLRPLDDIVDKLLTYSASTKVGSYYVEDFVLGDSVGITFAGSAQDAFAIKPAIPGNVKQSKIQPTQTVLSDILSWGFMSRSAGGGEKAFYDGTKLIMGNHLKSHNKLVSISKIYGQADALLGYVSYAPSGTIYRGAAYSGAGTVTLTKSDGSTIAFTNGINVAEKAVLFAPGSFAAGHWIAKRGIVVKFVDSNNAVLVSATLSSVDSRLGIIYLNEDITLASPSAVSGSGSVRVCFDGWENGSTMVGMNKILTNRSTLFDISASQYELWRGNVFNVQNKALNLKAIVEGIGDAVNAGGLDQGLDVIVNPRTFGRLTNDESALRKYDAKYSSNNAENGFENIIYYAANGQNRISASNKIKEGEAYGLVQEDWICGGSQLPSFKVQGIDMDVIIPLPENAGFSIRSYGDVYVLCRRPAKQILWNNINDEGVGY
jgi:hypothetical protein